LDEALCYKQKVSGSIPHEVIGFFSLPKPSSRIVTIGSIKPLTEMSTRNLAGSKAQLSRKADNLAAIREPIV
jgi:hypothetical protein